MCIGLQGCGTDKLPESLHGRRIPSAIVLLSIIIVLVTACASSRKAGVSEGPSAVMATVAVQETFPIEAGSLEDCPCWLESTGENPLSDIHMVVRTVNSKGEDPNYGKRLKGIADRLYDEWHMSTGSLIGISETDTPAQDCDNPSEKNHAVPCFMRFLSSRYQADASATWWGPVGAVAIAPWEIMRGTLWQIGIDSWGKWRLGAGRSRRFLLEAEVRNRLTGQMFRFYVTHLSHDDQERQRRNQIDRLIERITARVQAGEGFPIVVGDFNFRANEELAAFTRMAQYFELTNQLAVECLGSNAPPDTGIDHVWIGRKAAFPQTVGSLLPLRWHTTASDGAGIDLQSGGWVDGVWLPRLSDHNARALSFKQLPQMGTYTIEVKTGDKAGAGTNANVYIQLFGETAESKLRHLENPGDDFERNTSFLTYLATGELGNLIKIKILHDNSAYRPGWFLEYVRVKNIETTQEWLFPCNRWLAVDEADHAILRELAAQ